MNGATIEPRVCRRYGRPPRRPCVYRRPVMGVASFRGWSESYVVVRRRKFFLRGHSDIAIEPKESFIEELRLNGPNRIYQRLSHKHCVGLVLRIYGVASDWKLCRTFDD
jgi:hypothetical protein